MPNVPSRSREEFHLLNPAFCGALSSRIAEGYASVAPRGMPFAMVFVAMPLLLHTATREALPRAISTSLAAWIESHPGLRIGFADRARVLVPFVRDGLLFAVLHGAVTFSDDGLLLPGRLPGSRTAFLDSATGNVGSCFKRSRFAGRWLAAAGSPETVMTLWGVRP